VIRLLYTGDSPPNGGNEEGQREQRSPRCKREDERVAAFDAAVEEIAAQVLSAYNAAYCWLERTRAALVALLGVLDEKPVAAQALLVDSIAWGPEVLERRGELLEILAETLEEGRGELAAHDERERTQGVERSGQLPRTTGENLVGASLSWVHKRLAQESGPLVELAPSLMSMIVHPYLGDEAAQRELERSSADLGVELAGREGRGTAAAQGPVSRVRAAPS
jgi:hypothetical protein